MTRLTPVRIVLLYAAISALWIVVSGFFALSSAQDAAALGHFELFKGLLFVFFTSVLLYALLRMQAAKPLTAYPVVSVPTRLGSVAGLFVVLVLTVPLLGFSVARLYGPHMEARARANLEVVAGLKAERVDRWMEARAADGRLLATPAWAGAVSQALQADPATMQQILLNNLQSLPHLDAYQNFLLLDRKLQVLAATGKEMRLAPALVEAVGQAAESRQVRRTNLYQDVEGHPGLDWVVPIVGGVHGSVIASLVLRTKPQQLQSLLAPDWPDAGSSAEIVLVHRVGERIHYLSALRQPARLIAPQENAVMEAALQSATTGSIAGYDDRNQRVLSAYEPVAGSDWRVVVSIDRDEVLRPLRDMVLVVSSVGFVFVTLISLILLFLWRQQLRLQSLTAMAHKVRSERLQQQFFTMSFVGMAVVSPADKKFEQFNDYLCAMLGYRREEIAGRSYPDFIWPEDKAVVLGELDRVMGDSSTGYVMEQRFLRHDGAAVHALVDTRCVRGADDLVDYLFVTVQDISRYKAAISHIERLTQIHTALSQCNQTIVRCASERELFDKTCEIAVVYGGMKMAWIGLVDQHDDKVRPASSYGDDTAYLDDIVIVTDAAHPYGNGPVGRAIRSKEAYWSQDFAHDPSMEPWRDRGNGTFGSAAAVPISRGGAVAGVLCLYSAVKNAFDAEAQALLVEMAADISFALDNFDREDYRQQVETQLTESESKFHLLFDRSLDGLLIVAEDRIVECNPAVLSMMECRLEHILDTPIWAFAPPWQPDGTPSEEKMHEVLQTVRQQGRHRFEWVQRRHSGIHFPIEVTMVAINLNGRQVFYTSWRDISEQKRAEARLRHLAQYDALTGLPNRALLIDRIAQAINQAQRSQGHLALMFFDLDRFKNVNDSFGHTTGDELLIQVSRRLQITVRAQDTVARLGGDEFVVLLPNTGAEGASRVAEKVRHGLTQSYSIKQHELAITGSIGIAIYPGDGSSFSELLKSAGIALYRSKQNGRGSFHFFTSQMQQDAARVLRLEAALSHAVVLDQLSLNFQPQYSLRGAAIVGVEALLRWHHPEFGQVAPAEFIPIAEDTGEILRIGAWVLQQAIRQLKQWHDQGMHGLRVAVNLSAVQFRHPQLPENIKQLLDDSGLPAHCLELELTESTSMSDPLAAVAMMDKLADLGVRISIDDFGTGYSSLSYLKRFRASRLKIDRSFVRDVISDADDRAIVSSIISMARNLDMSTIAEGVENKEQLNFLLVTGCDEVQGYYFSRPLTAEGFELLYKKHIKGHPVSR